MSGIQANCPKWLDLPLSYYRNKGSDFRGKLFQRLAAGRLDAGLTRFTQELLRILQLSCLILDDVTDDSPTRRGQQSLHVVHGKSTATIWSVGIAFYLLEYIRKSVKKPVGLADKLITDQ